MEEGVGTRYPGHMTGFDETEAEEMPACQNCVTLPSRITIVSRFCHSKFDVLK